jgi:flagellar hook-associated protein FlgK
MTDTNAAGNKPAWDRFEADLKSLADELKRNYRDTDDEKKAAEISRSLQQLGKAAESFFESLDTATRDPEVRASTKRAARSFGSALTETFRDLSVELEKAFRRPSTPK